MKKLLKIFAVSALALTMTAGAAFGAVSASAATPEETEMNQVTVSDNQMYNGYIKLCLNMDKGRFVLGTTGGNPDTESDNDKKMLYGFPGIGSGTSYSTLVVDSNPYIYGDSYNAGGVVSAPAFSADSKCNTSSAKYDNVTVQQKLSFVRNISTGRDDVLEVKYIVTNNDTAAHDVGFRIMMDTMLGSNDSAPFRVSGVGDVTTETEFTGDDIPQYWQAFDDLTKPTVISQGSFFRDGDNENNPDKVQFCNWRGIKNCEWNYETTPDKSNGDSAVGVIWNEKKLGAGKSRVYTTYYGLSELTQDVAPPLSLSIYGDSLVTSKSVDQATGLPVYKDFIVTAYVENVASVDATNAFAKLTLPQGMTLAKGKSRIELGTLAPREIKQVSWTVRVKGDIEPGKYAYTVLCGCTETEDKSLDRAVTVPAVLKNQSKLSKQNIVLGEKINVNAAAEGGYGSYLYSVFYKKAADTEWSKLQGYSTKTSVEFKPIKAVPYQIMVKVKDENGSIADKILDLGVFTKPVNASVLSSRTINLGSAVTIKGKATGGSGSFKYAFYSRLAGTTKWYLMQDYTTKATKDFTPNYAKDYEFKVVVKDTKTAKTAEKILKLTVKDPLVNKSTVSAQKLVVNSELTVNCLAGGGAGEYKYSVLYKKPGATTFITKQAYSANDTVKLTLDTVGKYVVRVNVKDKNGEVSTTDFDVQCVKALKNTSTVSDTKIMLGKSVTVNCSAQGGFGGYEYSVRYRKYGTKTWIYAQKFSSNKTVVITPKSAVKYVVSVNVKDASGKIAGKTFDLQVNEELRNTSTFSMGEAFTVNASAKGGDGGYTYAVSFKKADSKKWTVKQDYSENSTVTLKFGKGVTYNVSVKVKDAAGNIDVRYFTVRVSDK